MPHLKDFREYSERLNGCESLYILRIVTESLHASELLKAGLPESRPEAQDLENADMTKRIVTRNYRSIFCQNATCFGTNHCSRDSDHKCQHPFLNAHHYMFCRFSSLPFLKQRFAHIRSQPARCCALQIASKKLIDKRKEGRLTSRLHKVRQSDMSAA